MVSETEANQESIFKGVLYYLVGNISSEVTALLDQHGAKKDAYLSEMVTHVIADSTKSDYYSEAKELYELPIVSSDWVTLSVKCGKQLPIEIFALEGRLFSGVVACPWQLEMEDIEPIWGMVVYHGGRCQLTLDKTVTHLITASLDGPKYERAKTQGETRVKIVTPDWVTDTVAKKERQGEELYHPELVEYPKPKSPTPEPEPDLEPLDQEEDMEIVEAAGAVTPSRTGLGVAERSLADAVEGGGVGVAALQQQQQQLLAGGQVGRSTTPRQFQSMAGDERLEIPRPDTPSAKEALARKISSRIQGKTSSEPSTPERPTFPSPVMQRSLSPGSATLGPMGAATALRFSPNHLPGMGPGGGLQPTRQMSPLEPGNIRNTLRNITNRALAPGQGMMQMRPNMPGVTNAKMTPHRAPPPEYPFAPRGSASGLGGPLASQSQPQQHPPLQQQQQQQQHMGGGGATPAGSAGRNSASPVTPSVASSGGGGAGPAQMSSTLSAPLSGQSPSGSVYFGHDPKENVHPELCLLGCVFCIVEYQNILGSEETSEWKKVIEQYGGQLEASYCHRVTHVLCPNQKSEVFKMALKEGKRVVSAFWLNDCLMQRKMVPPWQALHLPLSFNSEKPGFNQMISVTNFDGEERVRLKQMINAIGAKYTGYMTHQNSALICKKSGGMKFEKAKEWRIAVVNVQWLSDLVLGNMDALRLPVHVRYLQVGQGREFHMDLARVTHLMGGWKTPVRIHKDTWKKFSQALQSLSGQENSRQQGPSPPKRQKVDVQSPLTEPNGNKPKILFTLYPASVVFQLQNTVKQLGGLVVTNPRHCTHLVCPALARTMKFFVAINCVRHVVTKEWLEDSFKHNSFLDAAAYALHDTKAESALNVNLAESLRRAQTKPLLQGLTFYMTPSVVPPVCEMVSIVESAGGSIVKKRPAAKQILAAVDENGQPKVIVITCPNDLHLCHDLRSRKIPVFNAEFILSGVMRQEVDYNIYRIKA